MGQNEQVRKTVLYETVLRDKPQDAKKGPLRTERWKTGTLGYLRTKTIRPEVSASGRRDNSHLGMRSSALDAEVQ